MLNSINLDINVWLTNLITMISQKHVIKNICNEK